MSDQRYTAVIATVSNSLCDTVLDYSVNRFNYYKVLFLTAFVAMIGQGVIGFLSEIRVPWVSIPYVLIHAVVILIGYLFFVKSLRYIPIALIGLIEAGSLFLTFMIDTIIGYVEFSVYFMFLLSLFVFSVFLFSGKELQTQKNMKPKGFLFISLSILFYLTAPYLVKLSGLKGANEIAINLGYYFVAIPYFFYQYQKHRKKIINTLLIKKHWWNNLYFLCFVIGSLEALYYVFETISFINDVPTVVIVISQMRVFLLFLLSVLFGTDNFTIKKLVALMLGSLSVIGVYFI